MLFCTLQRIYSSVAIFSDYLIKKSLQFWRGLGCRMQTSNFRLCKKICCDCKTLIAQFKLQNYHQKTATILGSAQLFSNNYKVHSRIQLHWKSLCRKETTKDSSQIYFSFLMFYRKNMVFTGKIRALYIFTLTTRWRKID
jgi:hypothetical protein